MNKPTCEQLIEQLGNKLDITICSDVVYGLGFEYNQLKNIVEEKDKEIQRLNNIIEEFNKWLEQEINFWKEKQEKAIEQGWLEFGGKYNTTIIYENAKNKLKELKEGKIDVKK